MTNKDKFTEVFGYEPAIDAVVCNKEDWWNAEYKEPTTKNDLAVDCISRESVLKLIYDYKENHSNDREHYPINYGTLLDMIRWVCKLPSVTPQELRWIPISERLPEEYGEYLITWTTSQSKRQFIGISEGEVTSEYDHEHNRFKFEWLLEDYVKNYPNVKVTAWMPLPKPFEPHESEK